MTPIARTRTSGRALLATAASAPAQEWRSPLPALWSTRLRSARKIVGKLFRSAVDEPVADLRELAADRRLDVVAQQRLIVGRVREPDPRPRRREAAHRQPLNLMR